MNIPEKVYWELADYIEKNGGLTTHEIVKGFCCDEFKFKSKEDFLLIMKLIKQSKNTFWGIGPFINDDDKWYNQRFGNRSFLPRASYSDICISSFKV